jgi:hypothetical protein
MPNERFHAEVPYAFPKEGEPRGITIVPNELECLAIHLVLAQQHEAPRLNCWQGGWSQSISAMFPVGTIVRLPKLVGLEQGASCGKKTEEA